jgi:hypothetical protein
MIVGDTLLGEEIHLCELKDWLTIIGHTDLNINPYDVFDAYCVFNYLSVRFRDKNDPFLDETIDNLYEYEKWLMENKFWFHIRQIRKILVSPDLVVIGRSLARREFL